MATARKPKRSTTRKDVNTDPHWTNWEYLAAFGVDDLGYTYLEAVKRFCCIPSDEEVWLEDLINMAKLAFERAGSHRSRQQAACRVFRRAGMILLHDEMKKRAKGECRTQVVLIWPTMEKMVMITNKWKAIICDLHITEFHLLGSCCV